MDARTLQFLLLLVLPVTAGVVTLFMSASQGASTIFLSDAFNLARRFEPWHLWLLRYTLWHASFGVMYWFKRSVFPPKLQWLVRAQFVGFLTIQWSGFCQVDPGGYRGTWYREYLHIAAGALCQSSMMVETPALWLESARLGYAYIFMCLFYQVYFIVALLGYTPDTGIPLIRYHPETPLQYGILYGHLLAQYVNYPRLRRDGFKKGEACGCCCAVGDEGEPCGAWLELEEVTREPLREAAS